MGWVHRLLFDCEAWVQTAFKRVAEVEESTSWDRTALKTEPVRSREVSSHVSILEDKLGGLEEKMKNKKRWIKELETLGFTLFASVKEVQNSLYQIKAAAIHSEPSCRRFWSMLPKIGVISACALSLWWEITWRRSKGWELQRQTIAESRVISTSYCRGEIHILSWEDWPIFFWFLVHQEKAL